MSPEHHRSLNHEPAEDDWNVERFRSTWNIESRSVHDIAHGSGSQLRFGENHSTTLELYENAGVVRLTCHNAQIELHRQAPPHVQKDLLAFSHENQDEEIQLVISPDGAFALRITPHTAPAAQECLDLLESVSKDTESHIEEEATQNTASADVSDDIEEPSTNSEDHGDQEGAAQEAGATAEPEQTRLTITGRLGRNPRFRTTRNGTLVATFPVAVPEDDGSTSWHRVVAFDERAETLRDELESGDRVEVIGYVHQRQRRRRDGSTTTVEELYAAVVKIR